MQYDRLLQTPLKRKESFGKARLVLGARQTGKSTLFRLISGPDDLIVDLQERSERMRLSRDPEAFTRMISLRPLRPRHILVDEIQRVPELLDEIQLLLDRHPGMFTFTLTGSSARRLRKREANLLPGRVHRFHLSPVCLWEWAGRSKSAILSCPFGESPRAFPRLPLEDLLIFGNLPAAYVEREGFRQTIESYAEAYIEEEVLRESAARSLGDYGRFIELAAIDSGKPVNLTRISQESGVALSTLRGFYSVLEDTLLGFTVQPFSRSRHVRILKTPKFYFFDVGVRNAVARLPLEKSLLQTEGGNLLENWVACELSARIGYLGRDYRLTYWRTVDGVEVDFVLETPREVIPIEVKYTANPRPVDASGVDRFLEKYHDFASRGFVVCRVKQAEQLSPKVQAIPWKEI